MSESATTTQQSVTLRPSIKPEPVKAAVIALALDGKTKAHIARELGIDPHTVTKILQTHRFDELAQKWAFKLAKSSPRAIKTYVKSLETDADRAERHLERFQLLPAIQPGAVVTEANIGVAVVWPEGFQPAWARRNERTITVGYNDNAQVSALPSTDVPVDKNHYVTIGGESVGRGEHSAKHAIAGDTELLGERSACEAIPTAQQAGLPCDGKVLERGPGRVSEYVHHNQVLPSASEVNSQNQVPKNTGSIYTSSKRSSRNKELTEVPVRTRRRFYDSNGKALFRNSRSLLAICSTKNGGDKKAGAKPPREFPDAVPEAGL